MRKQLETLLHGFLHVGPGPEHQVRDPRRDPLVPPDQILVGTRITVPCPLDEFGVLQWSALPRSLAFRRVLHRIPRPGSRPHG